MRVGSQRHAPVSLTPGPLWTRAENHVPTRIQSTDILPVACPYIYK